MASRSSRAGPEGRAVSPSRRARRTEGRSWSASIGQQHPIHGPFRTLVGLYLTAMSITTQSLMVKATGADSPATVQHWRNIVSNRDRYQRDQRERLTAAAFTGV